MPSLVLCGPLVVYMYISREEKKILIAKHLNTLATYVVISVRYLNMNYVVHVSGFGALLRMVG